MAQDGDLPPLAVLSTVIPPSPSGQSRVLEHIVAALATDCIWLNDRSDAGAPGMRVRALAAPDATVPPMHEVASDSLVGPLAIGASRRAEQIVTALRGLNRAVLVGCSGTDLDLPAAWFASRELRIPFIAWLFDDPVHQWQAGDGRDFARWQEHLWAPAAAAVIGPNEQLAADFHARQGLHPIIIRNPVTAMAFPATKLPWPLQPGPARIVYTGSIYHAQADAFRNLLVALEQLDGKFELHIHTHQSAEELATHGVSGRHVVRHDFLRDAAVYGAQQSADVVFLPLAFCSDIQEVLRSSAPAKLGEYLACGRPLLVHAPPDSFVCRHIVAHRAGLVVDEPDPAMLVTALDAIAHDPTGRERMVARASALAEEYRVERARAVFAETVRSAVSIGVRTK